MESVFSAFSYHVFLAYSPKEKTVVSVLICRPVLEVERSVPRAVDAPFNRMQLWIFPSQRDNEVSSGAENEAVVCPGGHGAGGSKLNQVFVGGGASPEILPS